MNQQVAAYMPTLLIMVTVILGILYNNHRINHLDGRITDLKHYLDHRIDDLRDLMKAEIARSEATLRAELTRMEASLRADIAKLDQRLDRLETQRIVHQ